MIQLHEKLEACERLFPSTPERWEKMVHHYTWLRDKDGNVIPDFMAMAQRPKKEHSSVMGEISIFHAQEMVLRWTHPETISHGCKDLAIRRARKVVVTWEGKLCRLVKFYGKLGRMEEREPHVIHLSLKNDGRAKRSVFEDGIELLRSMPVPSMML